ncbi:HD domain-containing protein [Candidatus Pacebacteria bacterium]|nr:HD domain-containing protein [Candidatus Paceibacterota bacterium]
MSKAKDLATSAHNGQVRKSDGSPFMAHPIAVAKILEEYRFPPEVIAAALTHDVLEDTDVTEAQLRTALGDGVVDIVLGVTEVKSLPWEERKEKYIEAVVAGSEYVKAVSIADKIHNAESFLQAYQEQGIDLWQKFSRGPKKTLWFQRTLHDEVAKVWQHPLIDCYAQLVNQLEKLR